MMATTTQLLHSSTPLWTIDLTGRGTPVINGNQVCVLGYEGEKHWHSAAPTTAMTPNE